MPQTDEPLPRILRDIKPEILIYIHSGGADPTTGEVNDASLFRAIWGASLYHMLVGAGLFQPIVVAGGEETRKSGMVDQSAALQGALVAMGVAEADIVAIPQGTQGCLQRMVLDYPHAVALYYVNDDVHMKRYLEGVGLASPTLRQKTIPIPVPTAHTGYGTRYSTDYVLCYNAMGWVKLTVDYLKAHRPRGVPVGIKALGMALWAIQRVGLSQFRLFVEDRRINKASTEPVVLARIAHLKKHLRPDLLGESPP